VVGRGKSVVGFFFFFFSSRRRHTRFSRDWSSDVCSSDLSALLIFESLELTCVGVKSTASVQYIHKLRTIGANILNRRGTDGSRRSEERRVGKEWRSRWAAAR